MLHITCDYCHREIRSEINNRYVVKIEVYAAHDPAALTDADLDDDHMEAVSQIIQQSEDQLVDPDATTPAYKNFRYDLCPECHKKFVNDPLGKEAAQKFHFSEN
jgi:hypothetical protein